MDFDFDHLNYDVYNVGAAGEAERAIQKKYWAEHSIDLTVEAMMLDSKASDLDKEERPEVYSPPLFFPCTNFFIFLFNPFLWAF